MNQTRGQIDRPPASIEEILLHPAFASGYGQCWENRAAELIEAWSGAEQESYRRGREFAIYVKKRNEGMVALRRGERCNFRALLLLILAMRSRNVT